MVLERAWERGQLFATLTWEAASPRGVTCRARTAAEGADWPPWEDVPVVRQGQPLAASPAVTDGHTRVGVRCDLSSSRPDETPVLTGLVLRTYDG